MAYTTLLTEQKGSVLIITINRPDKLNALNKTVIEELGDAVDAAKKESSVKAVVLTGAGPKAFVAGADISEFLELDSQGGSALAQVGQDRVFSRIENCSKPFIAAVNGFALGGGCELAMACDMIIASESARFGQPEIKLGIIPGAGGTQRLPRAVGKAKAMDLALTGRMMDVTEAERAGLVSRVVPDEALLDTAMSMARPSLQRPIVSKYRTLRPRASMTRTFAWLSTAALCAFVAPAFAQAPYAASAPDEETIVVTGTYTLQNKIDTATGLGLTINDWSADGRWIVFEQDGGRKQTDLWLLPLLALRPIRPLLWSIPLARLQLVR